MKQTMKPQIIAVAAAALSLAACLPAHAQSKGDWMVRGGLISVHPQVKSGDLSAPSQPGTKVDVSADTVIGGGITYMLTDNVSVDLPLAVFLENRITGDGAIKGAGVIGTTKTIPATLFAQYRFGTSASYCRPYLGAGPTYAKFIETTGTGTLTGLTNPGGSPTGMSIDAALGYTVQAGVSVALDKHWFYDMMVMKTKLKTTAHLTTGQDIKVTLDPTSVGLYIGYKF